MNRCHICHSACYRPVITRSEGGQMLPNGRYQCAKCKFEFSSVSAWRGDDSQPVNSLTSASAIESLVTQSEQRATPLYGAPLIESAT